MKTKTGWWLSVAICAVASSGCANDTSSGTKKSEPEVIVVEKTVVVCNESTCSATCCGDVCRDLLTNSQHCGECGNACEEDEYCDNGVCAHNQNHKCDDGEMVCGGLCRSVVDDPLNCGDCGNVCTEGTTCVHRACVIDCGQQTLCNGECVDLLNDRTHCGNCQTTCAGHEVCSNAHCATSCANSNEMICDMMCVDVLNSADHCGDCSTVCGEGIDCVNGVCTCRERTEVICDGVCVDVKTDNDHCGTCGNACASDEYCSWGKCVSDCDGKVCDHVCLDVFGDPDHCGNCETACLDSEYCMDGACTDVCIGETERVCGHQCVDVKTDPLNCSACGVACERDEICQDGQCTSTCPDETQIVCDRECLDLSSDNARCGACENACPSDAFCANGACVSTCEDASQVVCDHVCTDITSDNDNCGECRLTCTGIDVCREGGCECPDDQPYCHLKCDEGLTACGGECVRLESDASHCGDCDSDCGEGNLCLEGKCVSCAGKTLCEDGYCYDTQNDKNHCGGCGIVCGDHVQCVAGQCDSCDEDYVDCDGDATNGCESTTAECECTEGETKSCYFGPDGTLGVGACRAGTMTCSKHRWGSCVGMVGPVQSYQCLKDVVGSENNDLNCDGIVDGTEDYDGDGYTICAGDCCDIAGQNAYCPATIKTPELLNPSLYEVPGNGFDDNCNGVVDEAPKTCSASMPGTDLSVSANRKATGKEMARAMDICDDAASDGYGLVFATVQSMSSKSDYLGGYYYYHKDPFIGSTDETIQTGTISKAINIFSKLVNTNNAAYHIKPRYGDNFAAISTGNFSSGHLSLSEAFMYYYWYKGKLFSSETKTSSSDSTILGETVPSSYLSKQDNGQLKTFTGCESAQQIHDGINLLLRLKAPKNATGFQFDFRFYSHEYPEYICTRFNDFFIALSSSKASGTPADGNIVFDKNGNTVSVNNAFFTSCDPISCSTSSNCSAIYTNGCVNGKCTSQYGACPDTSKELYAFSGDATNIGGATAWLTTKAPCLGGETFELNFYIWDTGDNALDSAAIIDNFRWITDGKAVEVGTDFTDSRT